MKTTKGCRLLVSRFQLKRPDSPRVRKGFGSPQLKAGTGETMATERAIENAGYKLAGQMQVVRSIRAVAVDESLNPDARGDAPEHQRVVPKIHVPFWYP